MSETSDPDEGGAIDADSDGNANDAGNANNAGDDSSGSNRTPMRPDDERYFDRLESGLDEAMTVAERAKGQGKDPEP